ncbi:hypothetical protein FSST1_000199 [Fusarium sambucinum]
MLTGFEALGAASAVLQVISFASDLAVACKNAYDGATTSQDDLQRYAGQMSEAVDRVHTRCEKMSNANSKFASPKLQNIAKECKDEAQKLEAEVQYVTKLQAKGDIVKSIRKAFRARKHQKKIHALQESLAMYQQVIKTELLSHLCSQNDAIYYRQDESFGKLDTDVQFVINQLAEGITDVEGLVKREHAATRNVIIQERAKAETAINSHTDVQVLELRTTAEAARKSEIFLQSLKAPRMNQRYNDVMDSEDASFNQVFASYEDTKTMYRSDSESDGSMKDDDLEDGSRGGGDSVDGYASNDDGTVESYEISKTASDSDDDSPVKRIYHSWTSFNSWLQSNDKMFYIQGKPGSGKSTLIKFILEQDLTHVLVQRWNPDAMALSYFFWKIGSEEQNSIKGLWCSLLYQLLRDQQQLILSILQHFCHLSQHSEYHDWAMKYLQTVWEYLLKTDKRPLCIFIDGLDEIRNEDGFSRLLESIDTISMFPEIKLCVSTRPEARIVRWLEMKKADGILLEDLTRYDMLVFVRKKFHELLPTSHISSDILDQLQEELVDKAQGVFLWLHLATRSLVEGIENMDSEDILFARLNALPGDLENLYIDLWQRMNAKGPFYQETARRYFRYVLQVADYNVRMKIDEEMIWLVQPWLMQISLAESPDLQEKIMKGTGTIELPEILQSCEDTTASIQNRCAGLLEVRLEGHFEHEQLESNSNVFSKVQFIHRTTHDFLKDTEAGRGILGCETFSDFSLQTQLLNGLICTAIVAISELKPTYITPTILKQITGFAKRWGNESLQLATEMLDIVRPLYDRRLIRYYDEPSIPFDTFFSLFTNDSLFDDFIISRLAIDTSTDLATSVLRDGWAAQRDYKGTFRETFKKMSKKLFFALIELGASPHEYGTTTNSLVEPFVQKATAFTNLLESFIYSILQLHVQRRVVTDDELRRQDLLETLEITIHMATTCENLSTVLPLCAYFPGTRPMMVLTLEETICLDRVPLSPKAFVLFEVNIQFLLLYLLSKLGGSLADCILAVPQVQDVISSINSPLVVVRYFQMLLGTEHPLPHRQMYQRVLSPAPLLPRDVEKLFNVDFEGFLQGSCTPHEDKTDFQIITQYIEDVETEEAHVEDMMVALVAENPAISTYEEVGIIPYFEYLRNRREIPGERWELFPLTMGKLEAAAAIKEGIEVDK